jgi:hypothetical protein
VSIEYGRAERRSVELTLDNKDGGLIHKPTGFWYDKVIKVFRGVEVNEPFRSPRILIIEDFGGVSSTPLRQALATIGFTDITVRPTASARVDLVGYEIIVSLANISATAKSALLRDWFATGGRLFTVGNNSDQTTFPELIANAVNTPPGSTYVMSPNYSTHPLTSGWVLGFLSNDSGKLVTGVAMGAEGISRWDNHGGDPGVTGFNAIARENQRGGRWVHMQDYLMTDPEIRKFVRAAFSWVNPVKAISTWETQIGEFMIDRIAEDHFPHHIQVTGRDYAKKCLLSQFVKTTGFTANDKPEAVIRAIAANAGVTKFTLPVSGKTLGKDTFFERGTDRWSAMSEIAEAFGYELFFDSRGYLVMREYLDPLTSPISYTFETGRYGNLVSYSKSSSDSSLFNHVIITGESADSEVLPVTGEAINNNPSSPTRVGRIGDRVLSITSAYVTTEAQADALALQHLRIAALEEFEFSFSSIMLPWLEVGEIIRFLDPKRDPGEPDRFLFTGLSIPLGLGPMDGVGKRVTVVT